MTNDPLSKLRRFLEPPVLTRSRIRIAYALAGTCDVVQLLLGPFGWAFADEILDIAAAALITRAIGFHPLLLPTFLLELLPVADLLPTWTGCVALVVALRKHEQSAPPPPSGSGPIIDI